MTNEFEELEDEETMPETFSKTSEGTTEEKSDDMVSVNQNMVTFDWKKAKDLTAKLPPRADLNNKEVIIENAEIKIPDETQPWQLTRKKDKEVKYCSFIVRYNIDGQGEYYSGSRVFKKVIKGETKCSVPSITKDLKNQASELMGLYAEFKGKNINEVSLYEFMNFLNSKPKAILKAVEVENPQTGEKVKKNLVAKFI